VLAGALTLSLARWIRHWASFRPEAAALAAGERRLGYAELERRTLALAGGLARRGIGRGDRVAFIGLNRPEQIELVFACAHLGAIQVPLNWRLAPPELAYILGHSGAALAVAAREFLPALPAAPRHLVLGEAYEDLIGEGQEAAEAGSPADALLIVYTSGTTGRPKGAVLTQQAALVNALNAVAAYDLTSASHVLTMLPMFHVGGLNIQTLPTLYAGGRVTLLPRFEPEAWFNAVERERPTLSLVVPAVMRALIEHPRWARVDLTSLAMVGAGSSTVSEALIRAFHAKGLAVAQVYGATETGPICLHQRRADALANLGSTGKPALHSEVRLVDAAGQVGDRGEIQVRGRHLLREYWNDPQASAEAFDGGWYRTGDLGHRDAAGWYWVDDRKQDLIVSGGENVYPAELENVLADCAEIGEAAVIGRPDPRWGEVAVACVVRRPGARLDEAQVLRLFEGRLARFKHPRAVVFLDSLPRNVMGKVQKFELRRRLEA